METFMKIIFVTAMLMLCSALAYHAGFTDGQQLIFNDYMDNRIESNG